MDSKVNLSTTEFVSERIGQRHSIILNAFSDLNYQLTFHSICTQLPG